MIFQTFGMYSQVCGYARAYASQGDPDAFANPTEMARTASLSGNYVDGVSITYGTPPTHIWTYATGASVSSNTYRILAGFNNLSLFMCSGASIGISQ